MSRSSFQRQPHPRTIGVKFLIVCEGDGEEAYFKAIRQDLSLPKERIVILNESGTDPRTIIQTVINYKEGLQKSRSWLAGDTAWAAFDGDEHRDNNPENWYQALALAQTKNINLALSNPSLELWYLLHYQDQEASIHRDKALEELRKHAPSYKKPQALYPGPPGAIPLAIQRAARLAQRNEENGQPFHHNPCSGIGLLVELLLQLRK